MVEAERKNSKGEPSETLNDYQWRELRDLLTGPERKRLEEISARLDDPVHQAKAIGKVLPDAITLGSNDDRIAKALQPNIDVALKSSVQKNPKAIADAIFPVLGPAIRKAIVATLMGMIQSLNHALNESVSVRGLKWRWEAFRSQRPYAEIVLLKTLVYRVEQIFLIHRRTGVVLVQVAADLVELQDPDLISGMLTAIQDFVNDSFRNEDGEMLDTLRMDGDHSVWIEQGTEAVLCVVIRGTPPLELRDRFRALLDQIHHLFEKQWSQFDGDVSAFAMVRPKLEEALDVKEMVPKRRVSPVIWILAAAIVAIMVFGAWFEYGQRQKWHRLIGLLRSEPGIVLLKSERENDRFLIEGFKDPLARDPEELIVGSRIDAEKIKSRWLPFYAMDDDFILRRSEQILQPPQGVVMAVSNGVLDVSGEAPHRWIKRLDRYATSIAGVENIRRNLLADADMGALRRLRQQLEGQEIYFNTGRNEPDSGQDKVVDRTADLIRQLQALQEQMEVQVRIAVIGHADPTGNPDFNFNLSQQRATGVLRLLMARKVDPLTLFATGIPEHRAAAEGTSRDLELFRKVTFKLMVTEGQVKIDD